MKLVKILVLENEVEARLLGALLDEQDIPYILKSYHDSVYNGLFQVQLGWGHVEAPEQFRDSIESLYADILESGPAGEQ